MALQEPVGVIARSTTKLVSFIELSVQLRLIWLDETGLAASPPGAAGTVPRVARLVGEILLPDREDAAKGGQRMHNVTKRARTAERRARFVFIMGFPRPAERQDPRQEKKR